MDVVDIVLLVLLVAAAIHGLRLGALVQVFTFGGFIAGLTVGAFVSVAVLNSSRSTALRQITTLLLVMGLAVSFGVLGRMLGAAISTSLRRHHLGPVDSVLGVGVAVAAVLLSAWLLANVVANSQFTWLNSQVQQSDILRSVDNALPPVPSVFARVQTFLSDQGFPTVFVNIASPFAGNVVVPSNTGAAKIAAPAVYSTVKVLGQACGYVQEGSGFVVGRDLVATNAHVVAGEAQTQIRLGEASYPATVVFYDPGFDLAILRTGAPLGPALALDPDLVPRGTQGAVLGYPNDGPLTIDPAGVSANITAVGRDIYDNGLVTRDVYEIDAPIEPGNSGGPLVDAAGQVVGVVFSRSTVSPDVGYALASPGVLQRVDEAAHRVTAVSTEGCVEG